MRKVNRIIQTAATSAFIAFALLLAGCGGSSYGPAIIDQSVGGIADVVVFDEGTATASGLGAFADESLAVSSGDRRTVYFKYDSSVLSADAKDAIREHARQLRDNPPLRVVLEGHADERGTREYNLALAEDRAKSVANMMNALGVDAARIETISYGEERPVAFGHDEAAWKKNRRVEILY